MLKEWQFNVLFFVGVGSAVLILLGPELGLDISSNPLAASGVGGILAYILSQKRVLTKTDEDEPKKDPPRRRKGD